MRIQRGAAVLFLTLMAACDSILGVDGRYVLAPSVSSGGVGAAGISGANNAGGYVMVPPVSSGGLGAAGVSGVSNAGGASSTATAIGVLGQPCRNGTYACAGHAQRAQIACAGGVWVSNGACPVGQNCDTRPGVNAGFCDAVATECMARQPNEVFCQGLQRLACGVDKLDTSEVDVCTSGCVAGACTECEPALKRCLDNGVQTCDASGVWGAAVECVGQQCTGAGVCTGACKVGTNACSESGARITCDANAQWAGAPCPDGLPTCSGAGTCLAAPSCSGLAATCGLSGNDNCCATNAVLGGTFNRSNDGAFAATLSSFRLDKYEVTVGRFRKFVAAFNPGIIPAGAGKNGGDLADLGWQAAWNASLPENVADLTSTAKCNSKYQTWTDEVGANENWPINCVSWYTAQAFCIWDGGRLPTEAEWNYAAAGGNEQREYPWGAAVPEVSLAVFGCLYNGTGTCTGATNIAPVGSVSAGDGRWGQSDLAGNLFEWVADWAGPYASPCTNCTNPTVSQYRMVRGGYFEGMSAQLTTNYRGSNANPSSYGYHLGFRCVRPL